MPPFLKIPLEILLWLGLAYLFYVEIGYLLLLWLVSCIRKPVRQPTLSTCRPPITVLVAAHNEQGVIAQKLDNVLAQGYPPELTQVIVASDHSTDRTNQIVSSYFGRGVILCKLEQHGGKIAALRAAEPLITGQVVVFTDADALFQPGSLDNLVRHFSNPQVGAVSGREVRPATAPDGKGKGEGLFNRIETANKRLEARIGNQVLLHGGIFAMRVELLPFIPDHLTHDGIVPLQLTLEGYDVLYEPQAVSVEAYNLNSQQDFQRRIRTVMQAFQSYLYVREALNPLNTGFYAIQIWSHRIMRWFVLPVLGVVLTSALLLVKQSPLYLGLATMQGVCYTLAFFGVFLDQMGKRPGLFYFPFYFVYVHLAAFIAVIMTWRGHNMTTWRTASRISISNLDL